MDLLAAKKKPPVESGVDEGFLRPISEGENPYDRFFVCGVYFPKEYIADNRRDVTTLTDLAFFMSHQALLQMDREAMYVTSDDTDPHGKHEVDEDGNVYRASHPSPNGIPVCDFLYEGDRCMGWIIPGTEEGWTQARDILTGRKGELSLSHDAVQCTDESTGKTIMGFVGRHLAVVGQEGTPAARTGSDIKLIVPLYPEQNSRMREVTECLAVYRAAAGDKAIAERYVASFASSKAEQEEEAAPGDSQTPAEITEIERVAPKTISYSADQYRPQIPLFTPESSESTQAPYEVSALSTESPSLTQNSSDFSAPSTIPICATLSAMSQPQTPVPVPAQAPAQAPAQPLAQAPAPIRASAPAAPEQSPATPAAQKAPPAANNAAPGTFVPAYSLEDAMKVISDIQARGLSAPNTQEEIEKVFTSLGDNPAALSEVLSQWVAQARAESSILHHQTLEDQEKNKSLAESNAALLASLNNSVSGEASLALQELYRLSQDNPSLGIGLGSTDHSGIMAALNKVLTDDPDTGKTLTEAVKHITVSANCSTYALCRNGLANLPSGPAAQNANTPIGYGMQFLKGQFRSQQPQMQAPQFQAPVAPPIQYQYGPVGVKRPVASSSTPEPNKAPVHASVPPLLNPMALRNSLASRETPGFQEMVNQQFHSRRQLPANFKPNPFAK